MTVQMTIIGLGQIGASIGLAISTEKNLVQRTGYDLDRDTVRRAEKMGAIDQAVYSLPLSVKDADLIILSLPLDQIQDTLIEIGPKLKQGAVVMDTGPVKEVVATWAGKLLPAERHYIGLTPVINPAYLHEIDSGLDAAHADLFRGGLIAIAAPPRTPSEAIKLAADLTRLLGSTPMFADPLELDGLMAATQVLPQLLAAGLLNATVDQPGWREGRKLAGKSYAETTAAIAQIRDIQALQAAALLNRENILRVLDSTLAALQAIRADIANEQVDSLSERLERARQGREAWWKQRQAGDWLNIENPPSQEALTTSQAFSRMLGFGFGKRSKPKK